MDDVVSSVITRIKIWAVQVDHDLDALQAVAGKLRRTAKAKKPEVKQRYENIFSGCEKLAEELPSLVFNCYNQLQSIEIKDENNKAGMEFLRSGYLFLENIPNSIALERFLHSMYAFMFDVHKALLGVWRAPHHSIKYLDISDKTAEAIFFHNGIATIGKLQRAIADGIDLWKIDAAATLECQQALMSMNYSVFPSSDNQKYWEQYSDQNIGLWQCTLNSKTYIYIKLDYAQSAALSGYPCLATLPDGSLVAKLAV